MLGRKKDKFPGGVHPTDGQDKALTAEKPIRTYRPEQVRIYMEQNFGGTCEPLVKAGDQVKIGQLIGQPKAFMAANIHSSVDGQVLRVEEESMNGRSVTVCVIKNESPEAQDDPDHSEQDIKNFNKENIIECIREAGLSGMGGAGFPTSKKYVTEQPIDTLLINAAECEPFLTCDHRLIMEQGESVIQGVQLLLKASGASKAYICLEDNKPEPATHLKKLLEGCSDAVEVVILPTKYPQGGERQLIQAVLKREVPQNKFPADAGVIVSNVGTAKAAADAVLRNRPLTSRIVTITGCVKEPGNFLVPIGTSIRELLLAAGGVTEKENRIILGGPMTGNCIAQNWDGTTELPCVTKTTSGVVVLPAIELTEQPCIRCGGCEQVCPAGLSPYKIDAAQRNEAYDVCEKLFAGECIACGSCSYICPAKRELAYHARLARDMVKQRMRERAVQKS